MHQTLETHTDRSMTPSEEQSYFVNMAFLYMILGVKWVALGNDAEDNYDPIHQISYSEFMDSYLADIVWVDSILKHVNFKLELHNTDNIH